MRIGVIDVGNTRTKKALFDGKRLRPYKAGPVEGWIGVRVGKGAVPKGTLLLGRDFPPLVKNKTKQPETVGADRLAQASAAWYRTKAACVVISMGTAITKDYVNARGEFVGGVIAPGLRIMARALHEYTALLPEVELRRRREIGRDTVSAIQAGLSFAAEGVILRRLPNPCPTVIGTGGDAPMFRDHFHLLVPDLALEGVVRSWQSWRS